jgi:hypothetical protein
MRHPIPREFACYHRTKAKTLGLQHLTSGYMITSCGRPDGVDVCRPLVLLFCLPSHRLAPIPLVRPGLCLVQLRGESVLWNRRVIENTSFLPLFCDAE